MLIAEKNKNWIALFVLAIVLLFLILLSITIGRYPISWEVLISYLFREEYADSNLPVVLWDIRLPRIFAAIVTGGALALAGASYQAIFKNPMVSPDILGVSSGAGFGASLGIFLGLPAWGIQFTAFIFGLLAVSMAFSIAKIINRKYESILMLVLTGIIISAVFNALISLIKYVADTDSQLPEITFWLIGSLASINLGELKFVIPAVIIGSVPLLLLSWKMNIMSFGDEEAKAMGINLQRIRIIIVICASLITASVVCVAGLIGWIGLIIPHFARFLVGPNHRIMLPVSILSGACFLLITDDISRNATALEIPLSIIIALIGAPFFLFFLANSSRKIQ